MKNLTIGITFILSLLLFTSLIEQKEIQKDKGAWEKLGVKKVNMQADHDVITVTASQGVYTKVKLKVLKAPIHLLNMKIVFGNGASENVVFDKMFTAGSGTRIIDLPGNKRIIKKVILNYKSIPVGKGKAVVVLFGKH